jgi:hypothetical protein
MERLIGRIARCAMLGGLVLAMGACALDQSSGEDERVAGVASELDEGNEPAFDDDFFPFDFDRNDPPPDQFIYPPEPPSCDVTVAPGKELLIRHLGVVEDPIRTHWTGLSSPRDDGAWTFGRLMTNMAGPNDPELFVRKWLARWETNRTVNGFVLPARPRIQSVLDAWPKTAGGRLDLTKAPMRLLAIVNRMDLRRVKKGNAGEGRFVFGVTDAAGNPRAFTITLEYKLPAPTLDDAKQWAKEWHALGDFTPGTQEYNARLQHITDRFTMRDANLQRTNGSAIGQVRTNESALVDKWPWEMREFRLNTQGWLVSSSVRQTPAPGQRNSKRIGTWINDHEDDILKGRHFFPRIDDDYEPLRGARALGDGMGVNPANVKNPEARHRFAVNTCDGCHGVETGTNALHISNRKNGEVAALSAFLTGTTATDLSGQKRKFDDLERRRVDFRSFLCTGKLVGLGSRVH